MAFDIGPYLASGRHVVSAGAGFAAGIGVHSIMGTSTDTVVTGFNHIFNGANEIAVGVGTLTPVVMAIWATVKSTLGSKIADVKAATPAAIAQAAPPTVIAEAATSLAAAHVKVTT